MSQSKDAPNQDEAQDRLHAEVQNEVEEDKSSEVINDSPISSSPLISNADFLEARDRILSGGVVAIPTETVYGLAASIESSSGLTRIFEIKERPFFDPLIVHVASLREAALLVRHWPPIADFLARTFWPGPLTLVLPKSAAVNDLITSGLDTVAIRYPLHPVAQSLIRAVGAPLAAPSANKFGHTSPSQASHVRAEFPDSELLILDGGDSEIGIESTVIRFALRPEPFRNADPAELDGDLNVIQILRPGGVTQEMLQLALNKWSHPVQIELAFGAQASPGHLKHHYMPRVPLVIVTETMRGTFSREQEEAIRRFLSQELDDESAHDAPKSVSFADVRELKLNEDPRLAARGLYHEMRQLAEAGATCLIVRKTGSRNGGLWSAIWDRLSKAASFDFSSHSF